jgi:hypothetical protein
MKGDKALRPAMLSRFPISSRNYTSNCFSFTGSHTINGPEAEGRPARWWVASKLSVDLGLAEAAEEMCRHPSLHAHPTLQGP